MRTQVLFIQGAGKGTHDTWDNKLVDSLRRELGDEFEVHYPRMPNEDEPTFATWSPVIAKELENIDVVVAHSIGATILINRLPKNSLRGIVLIAAPFIGDGGWPSEEIEPNLKVNTDVPIHLFHGDADETAPIEHLDLYAKAIPHAVVHRLKGRDHQLNNDLSEVARVLR